MEIKSCFRSVSKFFHQFITQSGIHGLKYIGSHILHILEKLIWAISIVGCIYFCVTFSLESYDRYLYKSTVVSIERDHYYWNTSLPSITICPLSERLNVKLFDAYCEKHRITKQDKEEFFIFLESLANSTYINFQNITDFPSTEPLLNRLRIKPENYMSLIYNLTEDLTLRNSSEMKVRNVNNLEYINCVQILTENGICYMTNNFLALDLSTSLYFKNKLPAVDPFYKNHKFHDVRFCSFFDGDMTYSFIGFDMAIEMYLHSPYDTMNIARGLGYSTEAYEIEAYSIEIVTTDQFKMDTTVSQRGCRFQTESNLTHFDTYSKGICLQECRLNLAFKYCGCIPHFYPQKHTTKRVCGFRDLQNCFPDLQDVFLEFISPETNELIHCPCLQNCLDSNVIVEKMQILEGTKALLGSIGGLIIMKKYPLIRYQREVLFTLTDLFVSIGGTTGGIIGTSVLTLIEILYFFSLRLVWYGFGYGRN